MKLYRTNQFNSIYKSATRSQVLYFVFNDNEREIIFQTHLQLMKLYTAQTKIPRWNKNDNEALYQIIHWAVSYKDGGKHADLSEDQLIKIDKMLVKLFKDKSISFVDVFGLTLDEGWDLDDTMSDKQMRLEMDRRRQLQDHLNVTSMECLFDLSVFKSPLGY